MKRILLAAIIVFGLGFHDGLAKSPSSSSSKPSGGSSYSKPSGGSSYSKPSGGSSYSKPSKPSGGSSYSKPSNDKPSGSSSKKPTSHYDSGAGKDKKREEAKATYSQQHPTYKTPSGKPVTVKETAHTTQTVRHLPPERVQNHTVIVEKHYHDYYGSRYNYYRSQPPLYIGMGYSSLFWYAMLDWDIHRQAIWMANNEQAFLNGQLNRELYDQRMQNAALRVEVSRIKSQRGWQADSNYVDPEFKNDPEAMLDPEFVRAASEQGGTNWGWVICGWVAAIGLLTFFVWLLVFKINWTKPEGAS